jgi:hypothetical protein
MSDGIAEYGKSELLSIASLADRLKSQKLLLLCWQFRIIFELHQSEIKRNAFFVIRTSLKLIHHFPSFDLVVIFHLSASPKVKLKVFVLILILFIINVVGSGKDDIGRYEGGSSCKKLILSIPKSECSDGLMNNAVHKFLSDLE